VVFIRFLIFHITA